MISSLVHAVTFLSLNYLVLKLIFTNNLYNCYINFGHIALRAKILIVTITQLVLRGIVGFVMGFSGIPNPESRSRGFGIGIFYFELDRRISKIPKSRGSGSGFANPEKIPSDKIPKIGIRDFFGIFYLRDIPGIKNPRDRDFFVGWDIPTKSQLCLL